MTNMRHSPRNCRIAERARRLRRSEPSNIRPGRPTHAAANMPDLLRSSRATVAVVVMATVNVPAGLSAKLGGEIEQLIPSAGNSTPSDGSGAMPWPDPVSRQVADDSVTEPLDPGATNVAVTEPEPPGSTLTEAVLLTTFTVK